MTHEYIIMNIILDDDVADCFGDRGLLVDVRMQLCA